MKLLEQHYKGTVDAMMISGLSTYNMESFERELEQSWKQNVEKKSGKSGSDTSKAMNVSFNWNKSLKNRFDGKHNHCRKQGHKEEDCWSKKGQSKDKKSQNSSNGGGNSGSGGDFKWKCH